MSFNPNVPNASQSPGIFPAQNNTNFARQKTIINADHVFNDSAQSTDGIHRQCTMVARAIPVALPGGSNSILYSWVDGDGQTQLKFYNGNTDVQITPPANLLAAVNFDGTVGGVNQTIRSAYNVSSVERASSRYKINFTNPLPNNDYIVQVTGKTPVGASTNALCTGMVGQAASDYAASVTTTFVLVTFTDYNRNTVSVEMGNVLIFGV